MKKQKTYTVDLDAREVQLIIDAFGTVSGHWNLEADELALVEKMRAVSA